MARRLPKTVIGRRYVAILHGDPCCYCGTPPLSTIDHIEPRNGRPRRRGSLHWTNLTAACEPCNANKGNRPLLAYLRARNA